MFGGIRKIPTECPHCGHIQQEPSGLISTYCRGCGDHYTVRRDTAPKPVTLKPARHPIRKKLSLSPARGPRIVCHECGHEHEAAPHAPSTACPGCGESITLHDITISGHSTRIIHTRGTVRIGREGFLNATRLDCGSAIVEGRIAGRVRCSGTLRLGGTGICRAQITARTLIIDRGASLHFPYTLHVGDIVIRGHISADVECGGTLHIGRHGGLDGDIQARAMIVDKGGFYSGVVQVATRIERTEETECQPEEPQHAAPAWQAQLAFG